MKILFEEFLKQMNISQNQLGRDLGVHFSDRVSKLMGSHAGAWEPDKHIRVNEYFWSIFQVGQSVLYVACMAGCEDYAPLFVGGLID